MRMPLGVSVVGLFFVFLTVLVFGRIFSKAGYSRWLGLLMLVPLANILTIFWFAYADWPIMQPGSKSPTTGAG
jgi:hypothetical protein